MRSSEEPTMGPLHPERISSPWPHPSPDLADPSLAMRDAGVDHGEDPRVDDLSSVDPERGPAKTQRGDLERSALGAGDLVHRPSDLKRFLDRPPDRLEHSLRGCDGEPSEAHGLGDRAVPEIGVRIL